MKIKVIASNHKHEEDNITHLIGQTFQTHDATLEYWESGEIEVLVNGEVYPLLDGEYQILEH